MGAGLRVPRVWVSCTRPLLLGRGCVPAIVHCASAAGEWEEGRKTHELPAMAGTPPLRRCPPPLSPRIPGRFSHLHRAPTSQRQQTVLPPMLSHLSSSPLSRPLQTSQIQKQREPRARMLPGERDRTVLSGSRTLRCQRPLTFPNKF